MAISKIKKENIYINNRFYVLQPACEEYHINYSYFCIIFDILITLSKNGTDSYFPIVFKKDLLKKELAKRRLSDKTTIQSFLYNNIIVYQDNNNFKLTDTAINILLLASKIQKDLDKSNKSLIYQD